MSIANLDDTELTELLGDLMSNYDLSELDDKYGFPIPQWITIKYRCMACSKETRSRIQTMSIRQASRELACPFCRKVSQMFSIHTEKESTQITGQDLTV